MSYLKTSPAALFLTFIIILSTAVPLILGLRLVGLGEGPDELSHIDSAYFAFVRPEQPIDVERGLKTPGAAPLGQGHQPPMYYWLCSKVLPFFHSPKDIGAFVDYQAALEYSSEGRFFGGLNYCSYRERRGALTSDELAFRSSFHALRAVNAVLFGLAVLSAFILGKLAFPSSRLAALSVAMFYAAVPTAIWRSIFVNNDNLVCAFSALVFTFGAYILTRCSRLDFRLLSFMSLLASAAFLSKYNGIIAIGFCFLVVLLFENAVWRERLKAFALIVFLFILSTAPHFWSVWKINGSLFQTETVAHVVPHLHKSSSFLDIVTDVAFLRILTERFWLEFDKTFNADLQFPDWVFNVWWLLLGFAVVGCLLRQFQRKDLSNASSRLLLYSLLGIMGSFTVVAFFGATFPMPGGRYLQPALGPAALFVVTGLAALGHLTPWLKRQRFSVLFAGMLLFMLFGQGLTASYMSYRFGACFGETKHNVAAGASIAALDLDGDKRDELLLFHRIRARAFVAAENQANYEMKPDWTRALGLAGEQLLAGDVNGDGIAELLFFRPSTGVWSITDGLDFTHFDESQFKYSDRAAKIYRLTSSHTSSPIALSGDIDGDGTADLVTYQQDTGKWIVLFSNKTAIDSEKIRVEKVFGDSGLQPMLLKNPKKSLIAAYNKATGTMLVADFAAPDTVFQVLIPPDRSVLNIDLNQDGQDDLLTWRKGETCFEVFLLDQLSSFKKNNVADFWEGLPLCPSLPQPGYQFDRHQTILRLSAPAGQSERFAAFSFLSGKVAVFAPKYLENSKAFEAPVTQFDPGWLGRASLPESSSGLS